MDAALQQAYHLRSEGNSDARVARRDEIRAVLEALPAQDRGFPSDVQRVTQAAAESALAKLRTA